jgi:CheY-like chemotaxis protein
VRVMAFEDHYDIEAMLVAGGVNTDGWVIEQRWNSSDAIAHIAAFAPDVLLLDHYMPPMTGYEVLERLLSANVSRPATIVAMSSDSGKNEAMVALGADIGVVKFDLSTLSLWFN